MSKVMSLEEILSCEHIEGVPDVERDYIVALYEDGQISADGVKFRIFLYQVKSGVVDVSPENPNDPF